MVLATAWVAPVLGEGFDLCMARRYIPEQLNTGPGFEVFYVLAWIVLLLATGKLDCRSRVVLQRRIPEYFASTMSGLG